MNNIDTVQSLFLIRNTDAMVVAGVSILVSVPILVLIFIFVCNHLMTSKQSVSHSICVKLLFLVVLNSYSEGMVHSSHINRSLFGVSSRVFLIL